MPNVNKVIYGNETLVDMTDATADASKIQEGYTAYIADGRKVTGTLPVRHIYIDESPDTAGLALFYE